MKKQLLIIILFASIAFAADFNITTTSHFDDGTVKNDTATTTDQYTWNAGEFGLSFPYASKDASLKSYWRLENSMTDETGYNNLVNNGAVYTASGKFGGAYTFDALDEMSGGDNYAFYSTGTTYCVWLKTTDITLDQYPLNKYNTDTDAYMFMGLTNPFSGKMDFGFETSDGLGNDTTVSETMTIVAGTWYFTVATIDTLANNYHIRSYLNGIEKGTSANSINPNTTGYDFIFGALAGGDGLVGAMDSMKVYDKKLNATEITTLYNSGNQYKSTGNWESAAQSMPSVKKMSNTTVIYNASKASDCIDKIEWLVGGSIKATYTDDVCGYALPAGWNYQEDADSTYYSALSWTNGPNVIDRNWNTFGETRLPSGSSYFYMNYTKPDGAASNSLWQVKDGTGFAAASKNVSIPASCWNYDSTKLVFRAVSSINLGFPTTYASNWQCWAGPISSWQSMVFSAWNANANYNDIYEEGVFWNIVAQTSKTIEDTDLESGSFDDVVGDFKIKTYLKGDGTSTLEVDEISGYYEQGILPATCDMFVNADSSNYDNYDDFTIRVKSNYFEEQSYNSFRVCYN